MHTAPDRCWSTQGTQCVDYVYSFGSLQVFGLSGGFDLFKQHYPFLCVGQDSTSAEIDAAGMLWPSEIIPRRLYIGSLANADNAGQCTGLSVETVLDLSQQGATVMAPTSHDHFPVGEDQELRLPILEALDAINATTGPVLCICENGITRSPAIAIAFAMASKNLPHLSALAFVMKRKRNIAPNAISYVQLQELEQELLVTRKIPGS